MNNQENQNNIQNVTVDYKNTSATVIGELRKDKIGRPVLAILLFVIFAVVLAGLPIVTNLLNDQSSFLYKIFNKNYILPESPVVEKKEEFLPGKELQQLSSNTNMKYENIIMRNFSLTNTTINCEMYSYNGVLNLDKSGYYLEVYSSSTNNLIGTVKLVGTFDNQVQKVSLTALNLGFNPDYSYSGKIVEMSKKDYPSVNIPSDESGLGSLVCKMNNRELTYRFKNNYLIGVSDRVGVSLASQKDNSTYLNLKKTYEEKAANLGTIASVEEIADGFVFNTNINLETTKIPDKAVDYNYFQLDTEAKEVKFTLNAKGFDCK